MIEADVGLYFAPDGAGGGGGNDHTTPSIQYSSIDFRRGVFVVDPTSLHQNAPHKPFDPLRVLGEVIHFGGHVTGGWPLVEFMNAL